MYGNQVKTSNNYNMQVLPQQLWMSDSQLWRTFVCGRKWYWFTLQQNLHCEVGPSL